MAHGEAIIGVEKLSKNELKRREKMKKKEAEKAAKEAAKAAKLATNPKPAEEKKEDEEDVDPTKYFENRLAVVKKAEETGNTYYPHKFEVQYSLPQFIEKFSGCKDGEHLENEVCTVAGRVILKRASGRKLFFYTLQGDGKQIQVMASEANYEEGPEAFQTIVNAVRRGDIIGIRGFPGRSKRGELSIFPHFIRVGHHSLPSLPDSVALPPHAPQALHRSHQSRDALPQAIPRSHHES